MGNVLKPIDGGGKVQAWLAEEPAWYIDAIQMEKATAQSFHLAITLQEDSKGKYSQRAEDGGSSHWTYVARDVARVLEYIWTQNWGVHGLAGWLVAIRRKTKISKIKKYFPNLYTHL